MPRRIAIILTIIAAYITFTFPFSLSLFAAPAAQATLPDFTLDAQTVISVTVAITDGMVIVIPIDLNFVAQTRDGETDLALITDVEQQAGIFIGVVPADAISATMQLPQGVASSSGSATPNATPTAPRVVNGNGTHVANRNANLRSGPGTDYAIAGNVRSGDAVTVVGQNNDGSWLELDDGNWIASFLVDPIEENDNAANEEVDEEADEENQEEADQAEADQAEEASGETDQAALDTYLQELTTISGQALSAVTSLGDLVQNPQPQNSSWRIDLTTQVDTLTNALDQFLDLTPVPGYEDLHTQVTDVALTCEDALGSIVTALDNPPTLDSVLANQSVQACAAGASGLAGTVQDLQ
jgi:uncharacterized protein YgiM (DUF1202 family)